MKSASRASVKRLLLSPISLSHNDLSKLLSRRIDYTITTQHNDDWLTTVSCWRVYPGLLVEIGTLTKWYKYHRLASTDHVTPQQQNYRMINTSCHLLSRISTLVSTKTTRSCDAVFSDVKSFIQRNPTLQQLRRCNQTT